MQTFKEWLTLKNEGLSAIQHLINFLPNNPVLVDIAKLYLRGGIKDVNALKQILSAAEQPVELADKIASFRDDPRPELNPNRIQLPLQPDDIEDEYPDEDQQRPYHPQWQNKVGHGPASSNLYRHLH